jgi:hypothetical protein
LWLRLALRAAGELFILKTDEVEIEVLVSQRN